MIVTPIVFITESLHPNLLLRITALDCGWDFAIIWLCTLHTRVENDLFGV